MAFLTAELTAMSIKYQLGILSTAGIAPGIKFTYNENFPQYAALPGSKVYIDIIPGAKTYPAAVANAALYPEILEQKKVRLTLDVTSTNRAYEARQIFGDSTSPTVEDWIYPQFVQIDGGASAGYGIALYHGDPDLGGVKVAETFGQSVDTVGWMFSYSMGVIVCSTAESAQFLTWYNTNGLYIRGFRYVGSKSSSTGLIPYLYQLKDVQVSSTGVIDGTVLTYNSSTGKWIATSTGASNQYLYQLKDVLISSTGITNGLVLTYNTSTGKWIASNVTSSTITSWATSTGYAVGDYVYLLTSTGSTLYRCMFSHTSSALFYLDSTYWEVISSGIKQWEPQGVFKKNDLIYDSNLVYIALSDFISSPVSIIDDRDSGYIYRIDSIELWAANTQYHIGNQVIAPNNRLYRAWDDHLSTANFNDDMYTGGHWVTEGIQIVDWTPSTAYEYRDMVYYTGAAYISNWGQMSRPLRFERDLDDGDWTPITPLVDFFNPDQIIATSMLVKNSDNRIAKATLNFRTVGTFDDHIASGDLILILDPELIRIFASVADAELAIGKHNEVMYCDETGSWYQYTSTGSSYTRDGLYVLDTGDGGDTRWLAVAGKYTINEINSTQTFNLKEQLSIPSPLTGYIKAFAYQALGNDIFTRLLLHFNNGNGSAIFDDSSQYVEPVTGFNGIVQSNAQLKFGISSGAFDGINQYLTVPFANFVFGTDDFAIDTWFYSTEVRFHALFSHGTNSTNYIKWYITDAGQLALRIVVGGVNQVYIRGGIIIPNSYYHLAMQRNGNDWYLYVNGTRVATATQNTTLNFNTNIQIGSNSLVPSSTEMMFNLYGYWKLDENIGVAINDSSGNGRNGTLHVGAWVPGKLGSALQFTGVATNYVDFGNIANFENNVSWTMSCWFNIVAGAVNTLMSKMTSIGTNPGYRMSINAAGAILVEIRNADPNRIFVQTNNSGFDTGTWRHLVVTYDGSLNANGVEIYVDSVNESFTINNNTLSSSILNVGPFNISGYNNGSANRITGIIDNCAIWQNRVLNQIEINYLYNANSGRYIDELATYYAKGYMDEYRISRGIVRYGFSVFTLPDIPYGMVSPYWILPDGSVVGLKDIGTRQWGEIGNGLYREDGRVDIYKQLGSGKEEIRVTNASVVGLAVPKVVKAYGYDTVNELPKVIYINSLLDTPIGVVITNISGGDIGFIAKRGTYTISGFDTTLAVINDSVYSTSTGDLTLTETPLRIGRVVSLNSNGTIYVNIGGERSNVLTEDTTSIMLYTSSGILRGNIQIEGVKELHLDAVNLPSDKDALKWDTSTGRFIWGPVSSSTGVAVFYNGALLDNHITELNFEGVGLSVEDTIIGQRATIYVPPASYSPYYNVAGAAVPNIATSNRFVAAPTVEGTPYKIGGWVGGTSHACTNSGAWNYTAAGACSFKDLTTTIEAILYDADGTTPLATHLTAAITGNIDVTVNNIRIRVTGFVPEVSRYKGVVTVDYTTSAILAPGGRCSIKITHHNAGTDYTKTQNDIFYDINNNAASLLGGATTIAETGGSVVTRFISGVEYYYLGSQFTINVTDIDWINCNSYPAIVLDCDGTEYGLPTLNLGVASLTGWVVQWDDIDDTYQNIAWTITALNFFSASTTANVSARVEDWVAGAWQNSANANILIETHNTVNTDTIERFYYENYRCTSTGNFDLPNQKGWTSSNDLTSASACFYNGGCERINTLANGGDFTIFNPNPGSQPNYSASQNATVYLWREFITDGLAHANARINITGTYTSLKVKMAKAWDGLATGGSVFMNALSAYNAGNFNFGNPTGGTGCQTGTGAGYVDITFGSQNTLNTSNTVYLKIGFSAANRVTALNMVFS